MRDKVPAGKTASYYYLARAYVELPREEEKARKYIESVIAVATSMEFTFLIRLVPLAEKKGFYDLATKGCYRAIEMRPQMKVGLLEKVLEYSQYEKNASAIVDTLKRLVEARPTHADYNAQLAYYRLLTGTELELAWNQAATPSEKIPQPLLIALMAMRQGKTDTNLQSLADITTTDKYSAGVRAVIAAFWNFIGLDVRAYRLAEGINANLLLEEEKNALSKALSR
jgi:hypothetical protein